MGHKNGQTEGEQNSLVLENFSEKSASKLSVEINKIEEANWPD